MAVYMKNGRRQKERERAREKDREGERGREREREREAVCVCMREREREREREMFAPVFILVQFCLLRSNLSKTSNKHYNREAPRLQLQSSQNVTPVTKFVVDTLRMIVW